MLGPDEDGEHGENTINGYDIPSSGSRDDVDGNTQGISTNWLIDGEDVILLSIRLDGDEDGENWIKGDDILLPGSRDDADGRSVWLADGEDGTLH